MTDYQFQDIIAKYLQGEASSAELRLVDRWYRRLGQQPCTPPQLPARELRQSMNRGFDAIRTAITEECAPGHEFVLKK